MHSYIILIPLYSPTPSDNESTSFRQCCKVLGNHPICIVTHNGVDLTTYQSIADQYGVSLLRENFDADCFVSVDSYSQMMLSLEFYQRFKEYKYLLIYQLDAYVFRDELEYWCNQGYDYIGAPWFEDFGFHEDGKKPWCVGNGGLSLRRTEYFINALQFKGPLKDLASLPSKGGIKDFFYRRLYAIGYQNNMQYHLKHRKVYEDLFYCVFLADSRIKPNIPDWDTACGFAFEKSPSYLFKKTGRLPFGCHAWEKFEYESFWKEFIPNSL